MNKILTFKNFLSVAVLTLFSLSMLNFAVMANVSAQAPPPPDDRLKNKACAGSNFNLDPNAAGANCAQGAGQGQLNRLIDRAVNIFSIIVGIIAVIMIIVGGLKFITSGGDSGKITSAKHTIVYALIGLVIVALAQVIVRFVLGQTV